MIEDPAIAEEAALEEARAILQAEIGDALRDARVAAQGLTATFAVARAAPRPGTFYFEGADGKWLAEAGSFELPAHSIEQDDEGTWRVTQTIHWPSGTPDAQIVAVWLVWDDMALRIALAEPLQLRNEGADFIASGALAL